MEKSVVFFVEGLPVSKARPRFYLRTLPRAGRVRIGAYTKPETRAYEHRVRLAARAQKTKKIAAGVPVWLSLRFFLPLPVRKKDTARATSKPDLDNLGKSVCDALNGVLYHDDAQIELMLFSKCYAGYKEKVGVLVKVLSGVTNG